MSAAPAPASELKTDRGILDVAAAEEALKENAPTTISAVLAGAGDLAGLKRLRDRAAASHFVAEDKAKFGPCVTNPEKIVCIGLNYRKHAAETGQPVPAQPILFNKYNTALNCCGGVIAVSKEKAEKFDYEAELVIVIGRTARNVAEAEALKYIFGYCTGNDFTARDLQSRSSQWMLGKTLDGSGPIGPWLVTADQVNGDNLKIECRVNGEVRQSSNTSDMVFNCKAAGQLHLPPHDPEARRHHFHRHAGGRDLGLSKGQAGVAETRRQAFDRDRKTGRADVYADLRHRSGAPHLP